MCLGKLLGLSLQVDDFPILRERRLAEQAAAREEAERAKVLADRAKRLAADDAAHAKRKAAAERKK